jgi:hypothetical protein
LVHQVTLIHQHKFLVLSSKCILQFVTCIRGKQKLFTKYTSSVDSCNSVICHWEAKYLSSFADLIFRKHFHSVVYKPSVAEDKLPWKIFHSILFQIQQT